MRTSLLAVALLGACTTGSATAPDTMAVTQATAILPTTLTAPSMLVTGTQGTFTVTGTVPGATVYLLGSPTIGTPYCPTFFPNGQCLEVTSRFAVLGTTVADAAGVATFQVRPPASLGLPAGRVQAGSIVGGDIYVSNSVDVAFVYGCDTAVSSFPEQGFAGVAPGDSFTVTFENAIAAHHTYRLRNPNGNTLATEVAVTPDGTTAVITPITPLGANRDFALSWRNGCAQTTEVAFTTGNVDAVGGNNLVREVRVVDLDTLTVTQPSSLASLVAPILADYDDTVAIQFDAWDGLSQSFDVTVGYVRSVVPPVQDVCSETSEILDVPFTDDPNLTATLPRLGALIEDATLSATVTPDGSLTDVGLSAYADAAAVGTLIGLDPGLTCFLLGFVYGVPCVPCPTSGLDCIYVEGEGGGSTPYPGTITKVTADDVLGNPTCATLP